MASSTNASTTDTSFLSAKRKEEILGVLCMAMAVLLALSFLSYSPSDNDYLQQVSFMEAFFSSTGEEGLGTNNLLGYTGAFLARAFVPYFMGYPALVLCGLLGWLGFRVFRHRSLEPMLGPALNIMAAAVFVCIFLGWIGQVFDLSMMRWGGALGVNLAKWLGHLLGLAGTFLLLLVVAVVGGLLATEGDVQSATDRFVHLSQTAAAATAHGAQVAWQWSYARYTDWQNRPRPEYGTQEPESVEEAQEEQRPQIKDPTEPNAPGFRLVRSDANKKSPADTPDAPPDTPPTNERSPSEGERVVSPPAADAASEDPPISDPPARPRTGAAQPSDAGSSDAHPDETSSEDPDVIRFDDVRQRIRNIQERMNSEKEQRHKDAAERRHLNEQAEQKEQEERRDQQPESRASQVNSETDAPATAQDEPLNDAEPAARKTASTESRRVEAGSEPSSSETEPSLSPDPDTQSTAFDEADEGTPRTLPADPENPHDVDMQVQPAEREETADELNVEPETVPDEPVAYEPPPIDLLDPSTNEDPAVDYEELEANKQILLDKLATYNIEIQDITAVVGPTVTRYEMTPAPGIKLSRIKSLEDDLAMAMAAQSIRILAPIPGKSAVGVEIPNRNRELVRLRDVIGTKTFRDADLELPLPLGKSIEGKVFLADLTKMPHLLVAGATGSGKSVGLNALIMGMIYACHPSDVKFVIIDPKKIELQQYALLEDHFMARPADIDDVVITNVDEACGVLQSCEKEMEERYDLLQDARVRNIRAYNKKWEAGDLDDADGHRHLPYVVVVVDELADLMMTAGDDIEGPIARLAQKARAVGIHLILATQRPSVDVITGLIKANFPSRMAYEVASRVDSRTILDQIGAEGLVGNGDLLFLRGSTLQRLQGPFVSVEEVERINGFIGDQAPMAPYTLPSLKEAGYGPVEMLGVEDTDELFEEAAYIIVRRQQGSVSLLQRKLSVGYTRAGRLVDQLEEAGIVGPFAGTKAREVLVDSEEELDRLFEEAE